MLGDGTPPVERMYQCDFIDILFCPLYCTIRIFIVGYSAGAYAYKIYQSHNIYLNVYAKFVV
jgi:hypothetical protein